MLKYGNINNLPQPFHSLHTDVDDDMMLECYQNTELEDGDSIEAKERVYFVCLAQSGI